MCLHLIVRHSNLMVSKLGVSTFCFDTDIAAVKESGATEEEEISLPIKINGSFVVEVKVFIDLVLIRLVMRGLQWS